MMRRYLLLLLLPGLAGHALAGPVADDRAEALARLRREVETLSSDVALAKEDLRGRLRALDAQKTEVEVQIRREELRLAQAEGDMATHKAAVAAHATQVADLAPAVRGAATSLRGSIEGGLPFHRAERLAEVDKLVHQLDAGELSPEATVARLWSLAEDELRLSRENGVDRQVVTLPDGELLADVARLGMAAMFFRTDGGRTGFAAPGQGDWRWAELSDPDEILAVQALFDKLRHGVRSGPFLLPNPYRGAGS